MNKVDLPEVSAASSAQRPTRAKVAYIVSGFPTIYETFVLYDMLIMEDLGVSIDLYPLRRIRTQVVHPEAQRWIECAHYSPYLSLNILRANWHFIRRNAKAYWKTWVEVLRGTWGCANFFLGAIAIFPKSVLFAYEMSRQGVAHVHGHFANHPAVAALIIHRLTGIPFSFTARGSDVQIDRHMLKEKVAAAESVFAVSSDLKRIMAAECDRSQHDKMHVIRGGVDVERLAPRTTRRPPGPLRILCVARFEEVKGHTHLIEACRVLRQRGTPFECRLIGEGPLAEAIEAQIKEAALTEEIRLLGPLSYEEVVNELKNADVLTLPTAPTATGEHEGMPTVLQEGMACGLPVVSCLVEGVAELVDDELTGILALPKNARALADAFERLAKDPALRQRMGRAGRQKVVQRFSLRANTAKRAALYLRSSANS